jgi:carboxyl-terminal processing protease
VASRLTDLNREYQGTGSPKCPDLPLVVLINGETSGGAELIAAALQDHQRAVVVGQRTLGKASIQTIRPLALHTCVVSLKLTTGTFVRPSGKNLQRPRDGQPAAAWGVHPDPGQEVRLSPGLDRRLRDWWLAQTLRPGGSTEALPLDDPANDPQRQAALQTLRAKLQ